MAALSLAATATSCGAAEPSDTTGGAAPALRVAFVSPAAAQPPAQDPAVIWYDNFDPPEDLAARYFEYDSAEGSFVRSPEAGYASRGSGMKCQFGQGQVSAGGLKVAFGRNPVGGKFRPQDTFREIYWRVYVQHQPGWQGNPAKLARATCLADTNWAQGFIAHVWGGRDDLLCIDPATGITDSRRVTTTYNDFDHLRWLGAIQTQMPIFSPAESGRWVCIECRVRLNTPGQRDGVFSLWIDGKLEASHADLDWHGTWQEYAINAVFLENYWNQGAAKREARYFDEFVISTQPIGPVVAASPPSFTRTPVPVAAWQAQVATSPDGEAVVWESKVLDGKELRAIIDAGHGAFAGTRASAGSLAPGTVHWLRLRSPTASGEWSDWTAWHAPFCTPH
jgi:hypothetical protein